MLKGKARNINYRRYGVNYSDYSNYSYSAGCGGWTLKIGSNTGLHTVKSPSWKGPKKWYRFMAPAGTRIPEKPPNFSDWRYGPCGTLYPGWLNGHHPKQQGKLVKRKVCFAKYRYGRNNCYWSNYVKIRHCGKYFVYFLSNAPGCSMRYCAENK